MDFTTLSAAFALYNHNFKILHWAACGPKFDRIHNTAEDYAEMFRKDMDIVVEMGIRVGQNPVSIPEIVTTLKESEGDYIVTTYKDYTYEEFCAISSAMLKSILICIEKMHEEDSVQGPENIGIRSDLEAMHSRYDLEYRYLNARRSM